jgi:TPR repeat protein
MGDESFEDCHSNPALELGLLPGAYYATSGEPLGDGIVAYTIGDYATAMRIFRSWTDQGNQDALTALGVMYVKGQGDEQDYTQALALFNRAVIAGSADAEAEL